MKTKLNGRSTSVSNAVSYEFILAKHGVFWWRRDDRRLNAPREFVTIIAYGLRCFRWLHLRFGVGVFFPNFVSISSRKKSQVIFESFYGLRQLASRSCQSVCHQRATLLPKFLLSWQSQTDALRRFVTVVSPDVFTDTRTQCSFRICDIWFSAVHLSCPVTKLQKFSMGFEPTTVFRSSGLGFGNLISGPSNFLLRVILLPRLLYQLQEKPTAGLELRSIFRSFDFSVIYSWSQEMSMLSMMQIGSSLLNPLENDHIKP